MTENTEIVKQESGIETVNINEYSFWTRVEIVRPYILKYLENKFPNSLILREFNHIDLVILDENIPVEIQSTVVSDRSNTFQHSSFEDKIRRQIEDNIENYNKCWFFFDMEYYTYLNNSTNSQISLNLDWFTKYVKDGKLKVFIVKYNGLIKELFYNDFSFVKKLSNTCKIGYENDGRILNRNKLKMISSVLKGYKYTQSEIDEFRSIFDKRENKDDKLTFSKFLMRDADNRKSLYGNILNSMGNLEALNNFLDINNDCNKIRSKQSGVYLGIFESYKMGSGSRTTFNDKFDICQYFPGYLRNKEKWDSLKGHVINNVHIDNMFDSKNQKGQCKLEF